MITFILTLQTDIIEVYWILITYLIYLLQVTTDFPLHFNFPHTIRLMRKLFV